MAYINGEKITLNPKFLGLNNLKPLYDVLGLEPTISGDVVTIEELTALVEGINALGVANLKKKLSDVADEVTTVEIMSMIDSISEIPSNLDHTVTFTVDGEPYEVVSVKDGNSVNEPTTPEKEDLMFVGWLGSENTLLSFPLTPTDNIELLAKFDDTLETQLYNFYGVSKADYPYVLIEMTSSYMYLHFLSSYTESTNSISHPQPYLNGVFSNPDSSMVSSTSVSEVVHYVMENIENLGTTYRPIPGTMGSNMFTNANLETYSKSPIYKI